MALKRGVLRGLWLLRFAVVVLSGVPALGAAFSGLSRGAGRRPYYTDVSGRMPIAKLATFFRTELPPAWLALGAVGVLLMIYGDQLLTGGAAVLLTPARQATEASEDAEMTPAALSLRAAVWQHGRRHLSAFLRVVLTGVLLWAVGLRLLGKLGERLALMGDRGAWSALTLVFWLPLGLAALGLGWLAAVGAWVFWCRLITAADGRRTVRRTSLLALRVLWRHPLGAAGRFALLSVVPFLAGGAVLLAWRQAEPVRGVALGGWLGLWLLVLLGQAAAWVALVRAGGKLYGSAQLADLRAQADEGFRLWQRVGLRRRWRAWRGAKAPAVGS